MIQCPVAQSYGLSTSLLERLTSFEIVKVNDVAMEGEAAEEERERREKESMLKSLKGLSAFGCRVFTLVRNYRSNVHILSLFNTLFYGEVLFPSADVFKSSRLANLPFLPRQGVPILFHHAEGVEKRDRDSPSWYNLEEVKIIREKILYLIEKIGVHPSEIGVITPYAKQVEKFKNALYRDYRDILVGTTEAFQGLERRVILISMVRSSSENVTIDRKFRIGFLSNPKRLNVAISRAMELIVVVGNGNLLASFDPLWHHFLSLLESLKVYVGPPIPPLVVRKEEKEKEKEKEGKGKEEGEEFEFEPAPYKRIEM